MSQQPITLVIIEQTISGIFTSLASSNNFTGYIPRRKENIVIFGTVYKVQQVEYTYKDCLDDLRVVELYVKEI